MFFHLDGEKWKIMKSGEKRIERQWSNHKKKSHKKEEVKRRETMRREKKKRKRKISRQYRGNGKLCSNWEQISRN